MLANRKLARHVADAGFGELRRQLTYKTTWNGGRLHVADRWYPSSKTCSGCQTVKPKRAPRSARKSSGGERTPPLVSRSWPVKLGAA
jgi:transposase